MNSKREQKPCPLCGAEVNKDHTEQTRSAVQKPPKRYPDIPADAGSGPETRKTRFQVLWEILCFIFGTAAIIVTVVDVTNSRSISWSAYPLTAIFTAWTLSTLLIFAHKKPWLLAAGSTASIVGLLAGLDIADCRLDWFWGFGLPIIILTLAVILVLSLVIRKGFQKRHECYCLHSDRNCCTYPWP